MVKTIGLKQGKFMKKLFIGLLALGSFSAFAGEVFTGVAFETDKWNPASKREQIHAKALNRAMSKCSFKYVNCIEVSNDETMNDSHMTLSIAVSIYGENSKLPEIVID